MSCTKISLDVKIIELTDWIAGPHASSLLGALQQVAGAIGRILAHRRDYDAIVEA